jgi:hypothetical protein
MKIEFVEGESKYVRESEQDSVERALQRHTSKAAQYEQDSILRARQLNTIKAPEHEQGSVPRVG